MPEADEADSFEVATVAADTLRASLRVAGALTRPACSVLVCVLNAHLRAGRHYLRVDVSGASIADPSVVDSLTEVHRHVADCGGMLVLENAGPRVVDAIRSSTLFVRAAH
jgi:hypothetical protein